MPNKAYNVTVTQTDKATKSTTASGTSMVKFHGELTLRGETRKRTVVAQGKAAELIAANLRKGATHNLRVLFERAPANEDGSRGGEFLAVVGLPQVKEAKEAA